MKNIEKKKLITWISIGAGLIAVIVLCVCLALGNKDKSGNKGNTIEIGSESGDNHKQDDMNTPSDKDSNLDNPSIELEDDVFENEKDNQLSGNTTSNEDDKKDDKNEDNSNDNSSSNDNSGVIVLPEVAIP